MFGLETDSGLMARFFVNQFFHNSIQSRSIQESDSCLEKRQRKRKRMAELSLSASVVAVATLDGCVCQVGRPCSLMMAMLAHKPFPTDSCKNVCVCDFFFRMDGVCVCL